ncbi:MAG: hypothetical protein KGN79_09395 [Acidobacteriota bacterium]|nr:hypothetical protein [Acidobacteriota bacterium]
MDPRDEMEPGQWDALSKAFAVQLIACLEECARGRRGLFADIELTAGDGEERTWPEAAKLRTLASALQSIAAQQEENNALCDEFLDLCTMHGESHPGEPRLAREFLARIERGEVGQSGKERLPW